MPKIFVGVLAVLSLTLLASGPQPAAASTFNVGTLSPGNAGSLATSLFHSNSGSGEQVLDNFLFKVSTAANVKSTGRAENDRFFQVVFTDLTAKLIEGTDVNCTICNVLATATGGSGPTGPTFDLVYSGLVPGTQYFIRTLGTFGGLGGLYSADAAISAVSPVPIPPALLLFGTAIVCAAAFARRRVRRDAKA
jgi:hypothetical protein